MRRDTDKIPLLQQRIVAPDGVIIGNRLREPERLLGPARPKEPPKHGVEILRRHLLFERELAHDPLEARGIAGPAKQEPGVEKRMAGVIRRQVSRAVDRDEPFGILAHDIARHRAVVEDGGAVWLDVTGNAVRLERFFPTSEALEHDRFEGRDDAEFWIELFGSAERLQRSGVIPAATEQVIPHRDVGEREAAVQTDGRLRLAQRAGSTSPPAG